MWLLLITILLTFLTGGRLRTRMDRLLVGAVAVDLLVVTPLSLTFAAVDGNLLLVTPDARIAGTVDTVYTGRQLAPDERVSGRYLRAAQDTLGAQAWSRAWAEGRELPSGAAIELGPKPRTYGNGRFVGMPLDLMGGREHRWCAQVCDLVTT